MTRQEAYNEAQALFARLHSLEHTIANRCPSGIPEVAKATFEAGHSLGRAHVALEALIQLMKEPGRG